MSIKFIAVNYNGSGVTAKYVESVRQFGDFAEIIIVDNASSESDLKRLHSISEEFPNMRLVCSEVNLGYFGGLNIGIVACDGAEDFVVVGNNDLEFDENFVKNLMHKVYPDDVFVVAPNVITRDGYNQNPHCRNRVSGFRKLLYKVYFSSYFAAKFLSFASRLLVKIRGGRDNSDDQQRGYIHMGIGACYVLLPRFFEKVGKLDDSVFLYGEEAMLAGQVMSAGGRIYYDPDLIVHHMESATLSLVPSKQVYAFAKESYPKYRKYL